MGFSLMIYGANGYTGKLITELAVQKGWQPIVAGRNKKEITALAAKYNLNYDVVDLQQTEKLNDAVLMADVVLHCAGPFEDTAKPMLEACIKSGTHYVDITGEIGVFEMIAALDDKISSAGIMALPGAGFDVVPTDCLAAYLSSLMPDATHLQLGFMSVGGGVSKGTATTMLRNLGKGGAVRSNGKIINVPDAFKTKKIIFNRRPINCVTIPWGDVSTAYHSTSIPNIEVYFAVEKNVLSILQAKGFIKWLINRSFVKKLIQNSVINNISGPSAKERKKGKSLIWGEVSNENGATATAMLTTPESYSLTAMTALAVVEKIKNGNLKVGFQTPSMAYGADFILSIEGTSRKDLGLKRDIQIK